MNQEQHTAHWCLTGQHWYKCGKPARCRAKEATLSCPKHGQDSGNQKPAKDLDKRR